MKTVSFDDIDHVEIFKAGSYHDGKSVFTADDVKTLAANTNKLLDMGMHNPPAKLGHDEKQVFARLSGFPAVGWVKRVYAEGKKMFADFADVPAEVVKWIKERRYDHVSPEIYEDGLPQFEDKGVKGMVLRAVAFLGADIPEVKGMGALREAIMNAEEGKATAFAYFADQADPQLMVPANRHPYDALVKKKGSDKTMKVHGVHPDGSYSVHEMKDPSKSHDFVPHDELTLMSEASKGAEGAGEDGQMAGSATHQPIQEGTMTAEEEKQLRAENLRLAEEKKQAEAVALSEKTKSENLAKKELDKAISAFIEKNKNVGGRVMLPPALEPKLRAFAENMPKVVKLSEKEEAGADSFLAFAQELIDAKVVVLDSEAAKGEEGDVKGNASKFEEPGLRNQLPVEGVDLEAQALAYAEKNKVPFRKALSVVAAAQGGGK